MYLTVCPPRGPGSIPSHGVFQGIFPWLITLYQPVLSQRGRKWLNLPSMTPHNLWTARRKAQVKPWTDIRLGKTNIPNTKYDVVIEITSTDTTNVTNWLYFFPRSSSPLWRRCQVR